MTCMYVSFSDTYTHTHNLVTEDNGAALSVKYQLINVRSV